MPELFNISYADPAAAAKALAENADIVLGVKVRMSENVIAKHGLEPLKRAIAACEQAGTGGKVMCHIGGVETRELMTQILDTLRPGDILTHSYSGAPNVGGAFGDASHAWRSHGRIQHIPVSRSRTRFVRPWTGDHARGLRVRLRDGCRRRLDQRDDRGVDLDWRRLAERRASRRALQQRQEGARARGQLALLAMNHVEVATNP